MRRAGDQPLVGIGEAVETDAERAADDARGAVGGDQVIARVRFVARRPAHGDAHAVVVLIDAGDRVVEEQFDLGPVPQRLGGDAGQLELLALQPVGMVRQVRQAGEIEGRMVAAAAVAKLVGRRFQAHLQQPPGQPQRRQHVEGGRMEGRGPEVHRQVGFGLEDGDPDTGPGQDQRRDAAGGPGAGDQDMGVVTHYRVPPLAADVVYNRAVSYKRGDGAGPDNRPRA